MKRIAFYTLGCKLNFSETSTLANQCRGQGFEVVDFSNSADYYVINTCTVTASAEKKSIYAARQVKKKNPMAKTILVGCLSQLKADELLLKPEIDFVLGSNQKFDLTQLLDENKQILPEKANNQMFISSFSSGDRTRSFLKIQDGCDYYCSYCTIPFARGNSRSDSIEGVLDTIQEIVHSGVKEIVLTGVNIGAFGKKQGQSLFDLLYSIEKQGVVPRVRISSVEPELLEDRIIDLVASSSLLMPHFHLPLQSGSDTVLQRMNRKYNRNLFAEKVNLIKSKIPDACIAVDVIAGFPGESETDFQDTLSLLNDLEVSYFHVFPYSSRKGTRAAQMEGKIDPMIIKQRTQQLLEASDTKKTAFYLTQKGKQKRILVESDLHQGFMYGFTENYVRVKVPGNSELENKILTLTLDELQPEGVYTVKKEKP